MNLPFNPDATAREICEQMKAKGVDCNLCFASMIIIDCNNKACPEGFKIHLDGKYPDGRPLDVLAYSWNEQLNRSQQMGVVWSK